MQHRKRILFLMALVVGAILVLWLFWPKGQDTTSPLAMDTSNPTTSSFQPSAKAVGDDIAADQKRTNWVDRARTIGNSMNRSVDFYGKIIDQKKQPVSGIRVEFSYSYFGNMVNPGFMPSQKKIEMVSDSNGEFRFTGAQGLAYSVKLLPKEGYEFKNEGIFNYSVQDLGAGFQAAPMSKNGEPHIFFVYKKENAEPMYAFSLMEEFIPDGRPYVISFKEKKLIEGNVAGDLRIRLQRPTGQMGRDGYGWSFGMDAISYEILESLDPFLYEAPKTGYLQNWKFLALPKDHREKEASFYIRSRNGRIYGRLELAIYSDFKDKSKVQITCWLNPSGSRNLEYDRAKRINTAP